MWSVAVLNMVKVSIKVGGTIPTQHLTAVWVGFPLYAVNGEVKRDLLCFSGVFSWSLVTTSTLKNDRALIQLYRILV